MALGHTTCTRAADNLIFVRESIRAIARKHGLLATFMPKYVLICLGLKDALIALTSTNIKQHERFTVFPVVWFVGHMFSKRVLSLCPGIHCKTLVPVPMCISVCGRMERMFSWEPLVMECPNLVRNSWLVYCIIFPRFWRLQHQFQTGYSFNLYTCSLCFIVLI